MQLVYKGRRLDLMKIHYFYRGDFRGKLLRLDIDNVPEGKPYGIPSDNPFVDEEGTLPEIYALGFRQPWTISVDPGDPDTGNLFLI